MNLDKNIGWCILILGSHRVIDKGGYILVRCENYHPYKSNSGYVKEHRAVMENYLQKFLDPEENIHHKNGNRQDNRIENLELTTNSNHNNIHWREMSPEIKKPRLQKMTEGMIKVKKKPRITVVCACGCGENFITPDSKGREHQFISGHNQRGKHWTWRDK